MELHDWSVTGKIVRNSPPGLDHNEPPQAELRRNPTGGDEDGETKTSPGSEEARNEISSPEGYVGPLTGGKDRHG